MKNYLKLEENEDGTCTMDMYWQDRGMKAVIPMKFDDLMAAVMGLGPCRDLGLFDYFLRKS